MLLSRAADALYWISRYLERAEHTARLVDVATDLGLDRAAVVRSRAIDRLYISLGFPADAADGEQALVKRALFDPSHRSSVAACIMAARDNARQVREEISSDKAGEDPLGDRPVREHVRHTAGHPQVVFENDEAAVLETHQVGARDRYIDIAVDADAAHLAAVVAAAVDQFARDDALGEDASFVVDVLEKEVDGDQALRQAALQRVPLARRHNPRQQVKREDPLGALLVAVDREGDALGQKGAIGLDLPAAEIVERHRGQLVDQRLILWARVRRRIEHLVVRTIELVPFEEARRGLSVCAERVRRRGQRPGLRGQGPSGLAAIDGSVAILQSSDRNVGRLGLADPHGIGAHDGAPRRPPQKARIDQRVDDVAAVVEAEPHQPHRLRQGQFQPWHLGEVSSDTIDNM